MKSTPPPRSRPLPVDQGSASAPQPIITQPSLVRLSLVRAGMGGLFALRHMVRGISWISDRIGGRVVSVTWNILFHSIFRHVYRVYRPIRKQLERIFRPAKQRMTYILSTRLVLHVMLVIIVSFIATSSINAEEVRNEDFGRGSILFSIVGSATDDTGQLIVEDASTVAFRGGTFLTNTGSVAATVPKLGEVTSATGESTAIAGGGAVIKPSLASTSEVTRPRGDVEYYIVQPGDTVSTIASAFNITSNTLLWENKLGSNDYIRPGDRLTILPVVGVSHRVASGDTLQKIADEYEADLDEIIEFNKLADASAIRKEQVLIVPDGRVKPPPAPVVSSLASARSSSSVIPPSAPVSGGTNLQWPTPGRRINQYFTWRHSGLDIDTARSPIYSSESGVVSFVGWGGGYGRYVIINHGGGLQTLYAHLSQSYVSSGESVGRGQTIGISGCTGWCTGDHLHFEVIHGGKRNPLSYL